MIDLPTRVRARSIRRVLERLSFEKFLDFGAGTGVYSYFLSRDRSRTGLAVDVDQSRIRAIESVTRSLGRSQLSAIAIDGSTWTSLPKSRFDVILAIEVLMCVKDPVEVLCRLRESLKAEGALIVHVPIRDTARPYELTLFNDENIAEMFRQAGFENTEIHRTFGPGNAFLCDIFSQLTLRPMLLAAAYPFLLLFITLLPSFSSSGSGRLIIARK